jgi:small neutral amino acid transporter SnatA (MarC family)
MEKPFTALVRLSGLFAFCKIIAPLGSLCAIVLVMLSNSPSARGNQPVTSIVVFQIFALLVSAIFGYILFDGLSDACRALDELVILERARNQAPSSPPE